MRSVRVPPKAAEGNYTIRARLDLGPLAGLLTAEKTLVVQAAPAPRKVAVKPS